MIIATIGQAEKLYGIELIDRTHLGEDDIRFWLTQQCEIIEKDGNIEISSNEGLIETVKINKG